MAPAFLGQDRSLKFPICTSVLGNVPKSPGQGKGNFVETGDDNPQNKIFCIALQYSLQCLTQAGPTPSSEISVRSDTYCQQMTFLCPYLVQVHKDAEGPPVHLMGNEKLQSSRGCKSGFPAQRWVKEHSVVLWGTSLQGRELGLSPNAVP